MGRILVAGISEIDSNKFNGCNNGRFTRLNKPNGCLWGSTYTPNKIYLSDWIRWVVDEDFHVDKYKEAISFTLKKNARICTIDTLEDYKNLMKKYSLIDNNYYQIGIKEKIIDWNKLSIDFDTFHLTESAFWTMRMGMFDDGFVDDEGFQLKDFYSYDCESWILFNLECINKGSILNHNLNITSDCED